MADRNLVSVKMAKYNGTTRTELIENNEYGNESLVKATKQVLDKINIENRTISTITSKEREDKRLWNPIALREAIINAFVHNDYSKEVSPKFEIFSDRIEITSAGGLPEGLSKSEFFEGYSVPRNKEIMRIYRDLGLVEQLGSGVPRILKAYSRDCFSFSDNFLRMNFPATEVSTPQVTPQVEKLLDVLEGEMKRQEIQDKLDLSDRMNFQRNYIDPALEAGVIEFTIPDKPTSRLQKYRLSEIGRAIKRGEV